MRRTKKYIKACQAAGIPEDTRIPASTIYGLLEMDGLKWDGKAWQKKKREPVRQLIADIRVSADPRDIGDISRAIQALLEMNECDIISVSEPYANRDNRHQRVYIKFSYRREIEHE